VLPIFGQRRQALILFTIRLAQAGSRASSLVGGKLIAKKVLPSQTLHIGLRTFLNRVHESFSGRTFGGPSGLALRTPR
jgi:hypothetical protein